MKVWFWGAMTLFLAAPLGAQERIVLPELVKPHQIVVDGNDLYVFDEADYSLHAYSISPVTPKFTFGRKGDGPREFKYLPFVFVQPDFLACTDFTKILWLTKKGEVTRTMEFSSLKDFDLDSEMLLVPVDGHFVRITADHGAGKRHVVLLDASFRALKELYLGPFTWMRGAPVQYRTDTVCAGGKIFVSDTLRGFHIAVFDAEGNLIRTIDKSREVEGAPGQPPLHQYCVADGRIYALTTKRSALGAEMIVLDLAGRILQRISLPFPSLRPGRGALRYDLFTVGREKLFELVEEPGSGKWELRITDLSRF